MPQKEANAVPKTCSIHSLLQIARNRRPHERRFFTKWNFFNVVKAMAKKFLGGADQKQRIGTGSGTQESTAKMGHCPEVDGNRILIHRVVFAVVLRLHPIQSEPVISFRAAAHKSCFVGNWVDPELRCRLNWSHKKEKAPRKKSVTRNSPV